MAIDIAVGILLAVFLLITAVLWIPLLVVAVVLGAVYFFPVIGGVLVVLLVPPALAVGWDVIKERRKQT